MHTGKLRRVQLRGAKAFHEQWKHIVQKLKVCVARLQVDEGGKFIGQGHIAHEV